MKIRITKVMMAPALFWITGFIALLWVILRSGTNPKRLTYPCQQAAYPLASAWVLASIPLFLILGRILIKNKIILISLLGVFVLVGFGYKYRNIFSPRKQAVVLPVWISNNSISDIYVYENITKSKGSLAAGDASVADEYLSDPAIDSLIYIMSYGKTPFFKTSFTPKGIVGNSDIVIIKCNFQRRHRLGTNTDRIKGIIWQILNHPEGFVGEVLICDNQESQHVTPSYLAGFNDYSNNSDDEDQSIVDVVNTFKFKNYPVDYVVWDSLNTIDALEYNQGDLTDGYIFNHNTLTSYPKFKTPKGDYVSLSLGIWDNEEKDYNKERLSIINFPVLKAHGMFGATIALKNYIGVMNAVKCAEWLGGVDNFHYKYCFSNYALVARELEIAWPDLNIIDATYVATESNSNYNSEVVQQRSILASTDPVAASWYAAKYILTPVAVSPKKTNPDLQNSEDTSYSTILKNWYRYLKDSSELITTKTKSEISVFSLQNLPGVNTSNIQENISGSIKAFPIPFQNELTISGTNLQHKTVEIKILDTKGQLVFSDKRNSSGDNIILLLDYLVSGTYILNIDFEGNQYVRKKIIKQ